MAGRPAIYQEIYNEQVEKLCKLGATDVEIADFFCIAVSTLNNWKKAYPEFMESIKRGKLLADANVSNSLYHRAIGYEHDSEEIKVVSLGAGVGASIERVPVRKVYPPDTPAAIFWLKNRQPKKWRDKIEQGFTNADGEDVIPPVVQYQIPNNGRERTGKTDKGNKAAKGVSRKRPK
ncbi:hypothetical protein ACE38W_14575 [Chitinophaga sp. Hz27]|uniref:hypothetical protein n=1 Tax=Chitinophaga sp. Hz27 TaxID=3347169 RepID=UPI0035DE5512